MDVQYLYVFMKCSHMMSHVRFMVVLSHRNQIKRVSVKSQNLQILRIRSCAKRALAASLLLVSRCSDIDVQSLEKLYRTECIGDFFDEPDMVGEDLLELSLLAKEMQDVTEADHNQLKNVLVHIERAAKEQIDQHERDQKGDAAEDQTEMPTAQDPDAALPDGQQLVDLTSNLPPRSDESQNYPKTLAEARF